MIPYRFLYAGGSGRTAHNGTKGRVVHAVRLGAPSNLHVEVAACGFRPSDRGAGWLTDVEKKGPTCPKCLRLVGASLTMPAIAEHDMVQLTEAVADLPAGTQGAVVSVYPGAFAVEFGDCRIETVPSPSVVKL